MCMVYASIPYLCATYQLYYVLQAYAKPSIQSNKQFYFSINTVQFGLLYTNGYERIINNCSGANVNLICNSQWVIILAKTTIMINVTRNEFGTSVE